MGKKLHVRVSIPVNDRGERIVRGPNVILSRQYLTPYLRRAVEFSRCFDSKATGPAGGNRSISAVPFDREPSSSDLEDNPLADYILNGRQLQKTR